MDKVFQPPSSLIEESVTRPPWAAPTIRRARQPSGAERIDIFVAGLYRIGDAVAVSDAGGLNIKLGEPT
jgi:hypothetical protein